ncbi:MAG: pyruvate kinase, partial [Candidatus Atribacteria bacterium]|nr:pyruvate kinase [Candidatus Atribacteria bacterium]
MDRKAKIVATMGPASQDEVVLAKLLLAGMNVARLNFSYGTHESHAARTLSLRAVATRLGQPLAILQDLQGPKIRVGVLPEPLTLVTGQQVRLYPEGAAKPVGVS